MPKIALIEYFRVPPRWLFVKITDDAGNVGWGEASLEGHTNAVEGCLDAYIERYTGMDADDIEHIWQTSYRIGFYRGGPVLMSAMAGIDIALWDLKARKLGVPVYQLLGGKVRDKIKVYAWIGGDRPSDIANQAEARKAQGFTSVKMNGTEDLGWLDSPSALDDCVERLKAVKALGMDAGIDFHGRVHKPMAKQLAKALEPHRPLFIEEPLLSEHPDAIKALSQLTTSPIALGERLHSRWEIRPFLESGAVDILQPDISHCGGISEMRRIAAMAETYDVALAPHCPLGPIALAANVQIAAATPNFVIQEMSLGIHYNAGSQDLTSYTHNPEVWKVTGGYIDLMKGPGLGIEVDEDQVRKFSKDAKAWQTATMADDPETLQQSSSPVMNEDRNASQPPSAKRQKKEEAERSRATRACDRCKKKKTRCSGRHPCILCTRSGKTCEFTAAYTRGRVPSIFPDGTDQPEAIGPVSMATIARPAEAPIRPQREPHEMNSLPSPISDQLVQARYRESTRETGHLHLPRSQRVESRGQSSRSSPEPSQTDLQGHYVGPSSGVSFLLRIQKKLHEKISFTQNSSIFTFGDAPLPEFDPSFFVLPPKADAEKLVARYFEFAVATHRFLHRPTVEAWLEEFYENLGVMRQKIGARERTALLFMVFAQAKEYMPDASVSNSVDTSARYFQAADHQLASETGEIRLTSVQARLCQCFYLLSQSRVNHCWSLFGTTAHLLLAIGMHRKRRMENTNGIDLVELECRKRVFWCAYGLDNYLSAALGRPRTFHDDDIDQDLPMIVNDSDLTPQHINISNTRSQSIMMASVAHNTLAKIISHILRDLYPIKPPSLYVRVALSTKYSEDLLHWRKGLSRFLDEGVDTSLLIPLFQRQRNVLNLAYYHALILVHRPFLLSNFASLNSRNTRPRGAPGTPDMDKNVGECLNAAMHIAAIVNDLTEGQQIYRAFWFTHYFAFCAVVVLYVYAIQQRHTPQDKYQSYIDAAKKCQTQISSLAENESLAQRYSVVLEELRLEAVKQTQQQVESQNANSDMASMLQRNSAVFQASTYSGQMSGANQPPLPGSAVAGDLFPDISDGTMFGGAQNVTTPSSLMADLTSWGEFDSLVTAGVGGLDFLFMGEPNRPWDETAGTDIGRVLPS
ncbi:D-galactonate dehydratase [Lachnellula occidentalis]|uniref:D-galactonate dehydratase n=1 Tax=Lachnellula occidentalis TaxID=215460 RepID=A0A8H8RM27_9HELO|nr:D-galactonate dehydratase [Lachnellula occidentalis]